MNIQGNRKVLVEIDVTAETAAEDAAYWLSHAANIFEWIHARICSGHLDGNDRVLASLGEVCGRAFRSVADDEGERLQGIGTAIRDSFRRQSRVANEDRQMLLEQADEEQAKGSFHQAAYLRAVARGEIDPLEPDGVPKGKKSGTAVKESAI